VSGGVLYFDRTSTSESWGGAWTGAAQTTLFVYLAPIENDLIHMNYSLGGSDMATYAINKSQRKAAKIVGFTYLFTMAAVVFGQFGVHARLIVENDAAETARNILAHERLFRISIACDLIYCVGAVVLLAALYVILKPVNQNLALLAAFGRLLYAMVWVLMTINLFDVLRVFIGADYFRGLEADQLPALARLYIDARGSWDASRMYSALGAAYYIGLLFYGLGSTVFNYLWFESHYIPRALAAWGVLSSLWASICAFTFVIFPSFAKVVTLGWFDNPMVLFEIVIAGWLLLKGLRQAGIAEPDKL
jgi:Domain of unknown function (DUF4386)